MSSWKDKDRKHLVRSDAKYNTKTAGIVIRLLAAGFTYADAGYAIGIKETTIQSWVQRYPVFKKQIEKVKETVNAITIAALLRSAWGYKCVKRTIKYDVKLDENGNEVPVTSTLDNSFGVVTETEEEIPPNGDLIKFILLNRDKANWRDVKSIDVKATNLTPELAGRAEAAAIDEMAGGLTKQIESTDITKVVNSEDRDPGTIFTDNSKNDSSELGVPKDPA